MTRRQFMKGLCGAAAVATARPFKTLPGGYPPGGSHSGASAGILKGVVVESNAGQRKADMLQYADFIMRRNWELTTSPAFVRLEAMTNKALENKAPVRAADTPEDLTDADPEEHPPATDHP